MQTTQITRNVIDIRRRCDAAAERAGTPSGRVLLVAAGKTNGAEAVREAIAAGVDAVGENRAQEMTEKNAEGAYEGAPLHFIGHLQRNKIRQVVGVAGLIQSVDSQELMRLISKRACDIGLVQEVLLEINIAGEETKTGTDIGCLSELLECAGSLDGLRVRGLMAIPPISGVPGGNRPYFARMRELFVDIAGKKYDNVSMHFLSMGMSDDFEDAIAEGSNMVRVGSAIFGARSYLRTT